MNGFYNKNYVYAMSALFVVIPSRMNGFYNITAEYGRQRKEVVIPSRMNGFYNALILQMLLLPCPKRETGLIYGRILAGTTLWPAAAFLFRKRG